MIEWRQIRGYPNYSINNYGDIYSRNVERLLKPKIDRYGYKVVTLTDGKKFKCFTVHRLVAEAFIDNPNNLPCVNHKDENKLNNSVKNLEYCTPKYNANYGTRNKRMALSKKKNPIIQYGLDGEYLNTYLGVKDAQKATGVNRNSIRLVCNGERDSAGGYKWKYYKEVINGLQNSK